MSTPVSGVPIHLESDGYTADLASVGATLRRLEHRGRPLVAAFDEDEVRPYYFGATLAPWPNRIVDGRYTFAGVEEQVAITEPERGQALHGLASWLDFDVVERDARSAIFRATIPAQKGYPHRVAVSVHYTLSADGLECTLTAENTGPSAAPFGTAPHPYLVAGDGPVDDWTLRIPAERILEVDERLSPLGLVPVAGARDFREPRRLGSTTLDHAFTDLIRDEDGRARVRIEGPGGEAVTMSWGAEYGWLQVFSGDLPVPELARRSLAVEPMTCPPDAFNSGTDLIVLQPGGSFTGTWRISAG